MTRLFTLEAGVIRLKGDDTRRFLNSMLTNNFRDLSVGDGNHNAITDRKGKVEGLLSGYMVAEDEALLVLDGMDVDWTLDRLDMYIIMDPIDLTLVTTRVASVQGPDAASVLDAAGLPVPEVAVAAFEGGHVLRNARVDTVGFDVIGASEVHEELVAKLSESGANHATFDDFEGLRVRRGLPAFPQDMGQRALPHELGLRDRILSFKKGCYMGQEVINRLENMGKLNRRLVRVRMDSAAQPGPVTVGEDAVGELTSIGTIDGEVWGLGLLRSGAWESGVRIDRGGVGGTVDPSTTT